MAKIPKFTSEQEESDFWDTHSAADYCDDTTEVNARFRDLRSRKNLIELRPDDETMARLRSFAHSRGKGVQMQIMEWVQQHLASEAPAAPAPPPRGAETAAPGDHRSTAPRRRASSPTARQ